MPLYTIEKTAQRGQVLLVATDKRGVCPVVSLQMPEIRAKQIVAALNTISLIAEQGYNEVTRQVCRDVIEMPIEKA